MQEKMINIDKFSTAIILAGGRGSRMGFDKQLLEIHRVRLIDRLIENLKKEFNDIIIVTNRPELYCDFEEVITEDIIKQKGPLSGIHAGLSITKSKYAFVLACDMPEINIDYIRFMKGKLDQENTLACVTKHGDRIQTFNAFYSVEIKNKIEEYLYADRRSINSLLKDLNITYISEEEARKFSPNLDMFLNLNTKEDLYDYLDSTNN